MEQVAELESGKEYRLLKERTQRLTEGNLLLVKQVSDLQYTIRLSYGWIKEYNNDADNATHAKRILNNTILSWQSHNLTQEERK